MDNKLPTTMTFIRQLGRDSDANQWHVKGQCSEVSERRAKNYYEHQTRDLQTFPIGSHSRVHGCLETVLAKRLMLTSEPVKGLLDREPPRYDGDPVWGALEDIKGWAAITDRFYCKGCKTSRPTRVDPGYCTCALDSEDIDGIDELQRAILDALKAKDDSKLTTALLRCHQILSPLFPTKERDRDHFFADIGLIPEMILEELA